MVRRQEPRLVENADCQPMVLSSVKSQKLDGSIGKSGKAPERVGGTPIDDRTGANLEQPDPKLLPPAMRRAGYGVHAVAAHEDVVSTSPMAKHVVRPAD
ncbi:MAG TPA: hypothetical protein VG076_16450 [Acidimicrobiales bacterium]|nr:hypothetical protein [Acidimicrobiales bacterium]